MPSREAKITAGAQALIERVQGMESTVSLIDTGGTDFYETLANYHDSTPVNDFASGPIEPEYNELLLKTPEELILAVNAVSSLLNRPIPMYQGPGIRNIITHERAHYGVAEQVGCAQAAVGLALTHNRQTDDYNVQAFTRYGRAKHTLTKLQVAAVIAAPHDPSPGDKSKLRQMGYEDLQEVADRIVTHNLSGRGTPIPAPWSYHMDIGRTVEGQPWYFPPSIQYI